MEWQWEVKLKTESSFLAGEQEKTTKDREGKAETEKTNGEVRE